MMNKTIQQFLITTLMLLGAAPQHAKAVTVDSITVIEAEVIDPDSLLENFNRPTKVIPTVHKPTKEVTKGVIKDVIKETKSETQAINSNTQQQQQQQQQPITAIKNDSTVEVALTVEENFFSIDSLILQGNPLFIDLVFTDENSLIDWSTQYDYNTLMYGDNSNIRDVIKPKQPAKSEELVLALRNGTKREISKRWTHLFAYHKDQLPDPNAVEQIILTGKRIEKITFDDPDYIIHKSKKIKLDGIKSPVWYHKATALSQFSGTMISDNWHQGGNSALAFLSVVNGKLIYDDKKLVQWENTGEWRMGFNWTDIQTGKVNDDVLKINSKFGVKVKNEYYITGSMDLSTQFFDIYKDTKNTDKKTAFFSPLRFNMALGLDYKHKKIISLLVSPIAYKLVYINDPKVNPNQFGIKTGENVLSEFGSAVRITNSYSPAKEIQFDSRFTLYTNYKQVEVDWELVCNLIVNRFVSTRIMLNPRFDNTIITEAGKKPELQFKGLMSVGFMHKF